MANYQNLKAAISAAIRTNGNQEITGHVLQDVLNSIVSVIGANYTFAGVATPATNPGTPDQNVMYLAMEGGTYTNFNGTVLPSGISLLMWNGTWTSETVMCGDGGVFDISVYKSSGGTLATFADLAAALNGGNNIPVGARKGGMSVKFVQSSDNNYIQYRCIADDFTTDVEKWSISNRNVYVENSKWNYILADKDGKIAFGIKKDGSPDWYVGIPTLIQILLNTKVDKVNGKGLIDTDFSNSCGSMENSKYLSIVTDSLGKIVESLSKDGNKNVYGNLNVFGEIRGLLSEELMNGIMNWILSRINSPHIFYCGSTREYAKVKDIVEAATQYKGSIVYLDAETFDITAEFGSDYLDNYDGTGNKMTGIWLKNDIHIIGANGSKLVFNYQGNNTQVDQYFSVFNADNDSVSTGFTLENVTIESTNGRYCVHDDPGQFAVPYHNKYLRCHFINHGDRWGDGHRQAIGGGFGFYGDVVIDGCQFESNAQEDASYHNTTSKTFLTAKSKVTITNTYFEHTFRCANFGLSPLKSQASISGCSLSSEPVLEKVITDTRADNMELIAWNNEIRN